MHAIRVRIPARVTAVVAATALTARGITFDVTPKAKMQFKYVFAGDSTYRASHSNVITLSPVK